MPSLGRHKASRTYTRGTALPRQRNSFAKAKQFAKEKIELHQGKAKMKKSKASGSSRQRRTFVEAKVFAEAKGSILKIEGLGFADVKKTFSEAKDVRFGTKMPSLSAPFWSFLQCYKHLLCNIFLRD